MEFIDSELQMNTQFILCVEEVVKEMHELGVKDPIDNRLFIGWNECDSTFFVRGCRNMNVVGEINPAVPFAFQCNSANSLVEYIKLTFDNNMKININLYNYNNIQNEYYSDLTYEFFNDLRDKHYSVICYDDVDMSRKLIMRYLRLLQFTAREPIKW